MERRESYTRSGAKPRTSFDTGDFALSVHLLAPAEVHGSVLHAPKESKLLPVPKATQLMASSATTV